ncbi:MAG TPA: PAS domain S-box protein, partial [Actinomycetota bacterium]|nr:PAS domain S-box protein [Actinomycetota bacterium]
MPAPEILPALDLLQGLDAIVWEADPATLRFRFVSDRAEAILGYPVARWLEQPDFWVAHLHPEDRERTVAACLAATEAGRDHALEYRMVAADGRAVWLRDAVRVVTDGAGRPVALRGVMVDVTDRRRAEDELRRSEERYRLLFERNPQPMWIFDTESLRFLAVNDAAVRLYGYSREEFLAMTIEDIRPPEDVPRVRALVRGRRPEVHRVGRRIHRRKDGSPLPVDIVSFAVDFDGRPARLVLATDATEIARAEEERRRAEEERRRAEERFRTLVENLPAIVYIDEPDASRGGRARPVYVSPQVETILGYSPEEWLADPDLWLRVVHPEDRGRVEEADLRTEETGEPFDVEYRALARDGRAVWFHDVAVPLEDTGGGRRWMGVMLDVTARRAVEEELAEREAHLRLLLEEVPAVIWSVDADLRFTSST